MRLSSLSVIHLIPVLSSATTITPAPSLPQQATLSTSFISPSPLSSSSSSPNSSSSLEPSATPLPLEYYGKNDPRLELRQAPAPAPAIPPAAGGGANAGAGAPVPAPVVPAAPAPQAPAPVPGAAAPAPVAPVAGGVGVGGAGAVPPAGQSAIPAQVPSVTVFMQAKIVGGVTQQVPVTYTQKFSNTPSQGPTPSQGKIGLGTITGSVGAVRTNQARKAAEKNAAASTTPLGWNVHIGLLGVVSILVATVGGGWTAS